MVNIMIYYDCLNMEVSPQTPTICFLGIMWIEGNKAWRRFVCYSLTRSNIQKTFSFSVAIMNVPLSIVSMDSMMNANDATTQTLEDLHGLLQLSTHCCHH